MIPKDFITEWRSQAPWVSNAQVEQDLVISRALVEIFRVPEMGRRLAFRGGTALHKLHLRPAVRYSEDIDLVQIESEPIGETFDMLRSVLDPWLDEPRRQQKEGRVNLLYRFESEDQPPVPLRLKIEINSREHFTELGHVRVSFAMQSRWWRGAAEITTFSLAELLGTKLRALYQRRKGRDLFDLWYALEKEAAVAEEIVSCFSRYMRQSEREVTRGDFERNLAAKLEDEIFRADISTLLRPETTWGLEHAARVVSEKLISRLPGAARGWSS